MANFGPLVHSVTVDRKVIATLVKWLPTYLTATEHREGLATRFLARPRSFSNIFDEDDDDVFASHKLPTVLVTSAQADAVEQDGDAFHNAWWTVNVSAIIRGRHPGEARYNAALYIATIRDLLTDKQSLDGFAGGVVWQPGERVRPVTVKSNAERSVAAGMGEFRVYVPQVGRAYGGPSEPASDPDTIYTELPEVTLVDVQVEGLPSVDQGEVVAFGVDGTGTFLDTDATGAGQDSTGTFATVGTTPDIGEDDGGVYGTA